MTNMKGAVTEVSPEQYRIRGFLGRSLTVCVLAIGCSHCYFPLFLDAANFVQDVW